jgi:citrate synthase
MVGFLTHCGFAHGGNGYEGIAFLNERFRDSGVIDPGDPDSGARVQALAREYAQWYARYRSDQKARGTVELAKIPGINHPVFRDKPVNLDPREVFLTDIYRRRGEYNAFSAFYHELVTALFEAGVSRNVYCVNVDAAIAALLLKILWEPARESAIGERDLENAAFTVFLHARMLGCAAEIDDHINRGRNMDTRTPARQCRYVL